MTDNKTKCPVSLTRFHLSREADFPLTTIYELYKWGVLQPDTITPSGNPLFLRSRLPQLRQQIRQAIDSHKNVPEVIA